MRLKIKRKKEKKEDQNKNNKSKQKENKNKRLSPGWDSNHDRLRGKQGSYPLDYCIIWLVNRSVDICAISVHRMGDQELKHIAISSQLIFFKSAKRSRKS